MSDWQRMHPDRHAGDDFSPLAVDGLQPKFLPQATVHDVLRLNRLGLSAVAIAAHLKVDVLSVEQTLRRVELLQSLGGFMSR